MADITLKEEEYIIDQLAAGEIESNDGLKLKRLLAKLNRGVVKSLMGDDIYSICYLPDNIHFVDFW